MSSRKITTVPGKVVPSKPFKKYMVISKREAWEEIPGTLHNTPEDAVKSLIDVMNTSHDDLNLFLIVEINAVFDIVPQPNYTFKKVE